MQKNYCVFTTFAGFIILCDELRHVLQVCKIKKIQITKLLISSVICLIHGSTVVFYQSLPYLPCQPLQYHQQPLSFQF